MVMKVQPIKPAYTLLHATEIRIRVVSNAEKNMYYDFYSFAENAVSG